jgi:hypothetical protein
MWQRFGGEGGIRTHVPGSTPDKTLSRRPRYDHFGTSPNDNFVYVSVPVAAKLEKILKNLLAILLQYP